MAVTASLVFVGHNRLIYRVVQDGQAGTTLTITTTGAASPDLLTDSLAGPLKQLARAFTDGYKNIPAGALNQDQARALWQSDSLAALGYQLNPSARCDLAQDATFNIGVDANVDGSGHPTLNITTQDTAGAGLLEVRVPNAIGA